LRDSYPRDPNETVFWELNLVWYTQWTLTVLDFGRAFAALLGHKTTNTLLDGMYSFMGGVHTFTFGFVIGSDDAHNLETVEFGLKTTQNLLTSVGEIGAPFIDRAIALVPKPGDLALSGVYSLLFIATPGILNLARTARNMHNHLDQVEI
jgi:hypothetical protein